VNTLAIILGAAFCLTATCGPAQAQSAARALAVLCPGHQDLAPHVDEAARRYLHHPAIIVAIMAVESNCRMSAVGTHGEICAMQIMPNGPASNGLTREQLRDPATCIATGARWLSLREVDCGGALFLGLSGYNARTCQGGKRYARNVLAKVAQIWREIARQRQARS
jgi:soluble lytic murein transglycosylase-like protein